MKTWRHPKSTCATIGDRVRTTKTTHSGAGRAAMEFPPGSLGTIENLENGSMLTLAVVFDDGTAAWLADIENSIEKVIDE